MVKTLTRREFLKACFIAGAGLLAAQIPDFPEEEDILADPQEESYYLKEWGWKRVITYEKTAFDNAATTIKLEDVQNAFHIMQQHTEASVRSLWLMNEHVSKTIDQMMKTNVYHIKSRPISMVYPNT
jgi:asparagine synthetase A